MPSKFENSSIYSSNTYNYIFKYNKNGGRL